MGGARGGDAGFHQRHADAPAALRVLHRQGAEEQRTRWADGDGPEAHRSAQHPILNGDKAEPRDRADALAQAVG
jgi:hypothetical protein